ncbi:hypothetical protein LN474_15980 [Xanthomonas codiaei]|uniref:hypothetical protein n=2 Tax=Xanthomonas TaxID=338 RepID=UPI001E49AB47|nr:hypothetical protein [Xanthomonas codiaei]MCC8538444.1 hypothetical protein [Xanthomonas codiaei]
MVKKLHYLIIFLIPSFAMPLTARALSAPGDLRCLALQATNVVVVSDMRTDKLIMEDYLGRLYLTRLAVIHQIKGSVEILGKKKENIDVIVRREDPHSAGKKLLDSKENLIFIKNTDQGPLILGGSSGVLPYSNGIYVYGTKLNPGAIKIFFSDKNITTNKCHNMVID